MCMRTLFRAGPLLAVVLSAAGCGYSAQADEQPVEPAKVEAINGSDESRIILSADAAKRIGLQVAPVRSMRVERRVVVRGQVVALRSATWVRILAQAGRLSGVRAGSPALILRPQGGGVRGVAGTSPPRGGSATGPWLYVKASTAAALQPGQAVRVRLSLGAGVERTTIPYSAVIYWIDGRTWTYERTGPLSFVRRPITVESVDGDVAVLSTGPAVGSDVVAVGGVELLGTEFEIEGE